VPSSINLPLHHEVQKFSSGTGSSGWSRKNGRKTVVCVCMIIAGLVAMVPAGDMANGDMWPQVATL